VTFPTDIPQVVLKDVTADNVLVPQFYINGADFNMMQAEQFGMATQLGSTPKLDLTVSGGSLGVSGPAQSIIGGLVVSIAGGTVPFTLPGVTFVWSDDSGVLTTGLALPTTVNYLPIAQVTTGAGGVILSFVDLRPWLIGTGGGGGSVLPTNFRCNTSEPRFSQRDIVALLDTDFLTSAIVPISDSAYFNIEIVSDTGGTLTLVQREGVTTTLIVLGVLVAGVNKVFSNVLAPRLYDGGGTPLDYQIRLDSAATIEFCSIVEVEFDALCSTSAGVSGMELIPFSVPFTFATASPLTAFTALAGDVLTECEVVIETPFDGTGVLMKVGVAGDLGVVLSQFEVAATVAGQYTTLADRTSAIGESYLATIVPGTSTQGSGYVSGIIRR